MTKAVAKQAADCDGLVPERTCVVSRRNAEPDDLIRFVVGPDTTVVPDILHKLPGRGAWVLAHRDIVARAAKTGAFARSFKAKVAVSPDIAVTVESLLERHALEALSLANKAGLVVAGFGKVDDLLASGQTRALVHASDGSDGGAGRLTRKFQAICREVGTTPIVIDAFTHAQLGLALGRLNVVHAGLSPGRAVDRFVKAVERLMRYRQPPQEFSEEFSTITPGSADPVRGRDAGSETEEV